MVVAYQDLAKAIDRMASLPSCIVNRPHHLLHMTRFVCMSRRGFKVLIELRQTGGLPADVGSGQSGESGKPLKSEILASVRETF